jgi:phosphoribosylformimino-5-aminoimidazole carboxamide ribotide isomerase
VISEALVRYPGRVLISIDIKDDRVISGFLENDPIRAYQQIIELGVDRVIFLNISAVGTGKPNFSFMKGLNKTGEIILGGGITKDDLDYMEKNHVDGVLVGTSLHRGLWM